jgi:acyl-CoA thioesterase-2
MEPFAPGASLTDLFALDPQGSVWRNRQTILNIGGIMLGGHIAAFGIKAAWLTARDALPAAAHVLMLSSPDPQQPCDHQVEVIRDGRRLAHRNTAISQNGRLCAQVTNTLARPALAQSAPAFRHPIRPPAVPEPQSLPGREDLLAALPPSAGGMRRRILQGHPFLDIREVPCDKGQDGHGMFWVRVVEAAGLEPIDQYCLLALISDFWFVLPIHHLPGASAAMGDDFVTTSLDHALWFHGQPDCADWMLFDMRASAAGGGLGTKHGEVWDRTGQPLATFAQHSLLFPSGGS